MMPRKINTVRFIDTNLLVIVINLYCIIPYGTKILLGIKFYGFTVVGKIVKLNPLTFTIMLQRY